MATQCAKKIIPGLGYRKAGSPESAASSSKPDVPASPFAAGEAVEPPAEAAGAPLQQQATNNASACFAATGPSPFAPRLTEEMRLQCPYDLRSMLDFICDPTTGDADKNSRIEMLKKYAEQGQESAKQCLEAYAGFRAHCQASIVPAVAGSIGSSKPRQEEHALTDRQKRVQANSSLNAAKAELQRLEKGYEKNRANIKWVADQEQKAAQAQKEWQEELARKTKEGDDFRAQITAARAKEHECTMSLDALRNVQDRAGQHQESAEKAFVPFTPSELEEFSKQQGPMGFAQAVLRKMAAKVAAGEGTWADLEKAAAPEPSLQTPSASVESCPATAPAEPITINTYLDAELECEMDDNCLPASDWAPELVQQTEEQATDCHAMDRTASIKRGLVSEDKKTGEQDAKEAAIPVPDDEDILEENGGMDISSLEATEQEAAEELANAKQEQAKSRRTDAVPQKSAAEIALEMASQLAEQAAAASAVQPSSGSSSSTAAGPSQQQG